MMLELTCTFAAKLSENLTRLTWSFPLHLTQEWPGAGLFRPKFEIFKVIFDRESGELAVKESGYQPRGLFHSRYRTRILSEIYGNAGDGMPVMFANYSEL